MTIDSKPYPLEKARAYIARRVQELRKDRHWTQAELSRRLNLSQSRLSEIERGAGSFTAEQFLEILRLFNVAASDFDRRRSDPSSDLQNALARLGALHLQESTTVLPSERLAKVTDAIREAIVAGEHPRLVTAIAPVLVRNIDAIHPSKLHVDLEAAGLGRRFGWIAANTLEAIRHEAPSASPSWKKLYARATVVLESLLSFIAPEHHNQPVPLDILDAGIRSKKTLDDVIASRSSLSHRWGIASNLRPEDFALALRGARDARP
jgi:transcriptional regulator with XRE-family HTH domain